MDPLDKAQVLLLCDLCQRAALQSHCEICQISLCKACVGEHLSDSSKRHNVVPYNQRSSTPNYPECPNHSRKHCELYCEKCDISVCSTCISSDKHHGHKFTDVLKKLSRKKNDLEEDLEELEKRIYPTYEKIILDLNSKKVNFEKYYKKLTTAVTKQGEHWHSEINIIVNKQKSEIEEMKTKHLAALDKREKDIKQITSEIKQSSLDLKKMLDSNDLSLISAYKSRNTEFRSLPPKIIVYLPRFSSHKINTEKLHQLFGTLSALSITTEKDCSTMKTSEAVSCPPVKPLLDEPELINAINTWYQHSLYSVTCLSDEKIWTLGNDKIMKLYNLQGKLLTAIQTKSGNTPCGITVTRNGDLVYTDAGTRTVNIVKDKQQEVIRLDGWKPFNICKTSTDDLLVTMESDYSKESKVVRYSGSTEKQTIQFDIDGNPLYSTSRVKYISENRNLDICVADLGARAVVVVNQAGKLRFRYTGDPYATKELFNPLGITTDSQSQILIADRDNNCIHILDQDGQFLRYINNCDLQLPLGLCVDTRDDLFVSEWGSRKMKKIKYM